jgi:hypothetical protein
MNRENILAVADAIEKHSIPDLGFNMRPLLSDFNAGDDMKNHFGTDCSTIACVAGWSFLLSGGDAKERDTETIWDGATDWLGLPRPQSVRLFAPGEYLGHFRALTDTQAVSVLRHLAETGEVDWNRALSPTEGERG